MDFKKESPAALEARLKTMLPEMYQECYEDVQPTSMGSASLKYDKNGEVVWDEIWDSFCDLAMAGGPPHKGTLLTPGTPEEIDAEPDRYQQVTREICRGIYLVTDLEAKPSGFPGWVRVQCDDPVMAEWLVRAIVMENVSAHWEGDAIFLPASPAYRVEKEIKNVITVIAKTCHYWVDHMRLSQQRKIADLFAAMAVDTPLLVPAFPTADWLGLECSSEHAAIWMMRGMVASNVLARREGHVLFVPINEKNDPSAKRALQTLARVQAFAQAKAIP